jgi:hypothetical protein
MRTCAASSCCPQRLALTEPVAKLQRRYLVAKALAAFPAVEFAHLEQEDAQGMLTGKACIGDVAVVLDLGLKGGKVVYETSGRQ